MEQNFYQDFLELTNALESARTVEGGRIYDSDYGGFLSSDNKRNMYSNNYANFMNYMIARQTNADNAALAEKQNQWNEAHWEKETAYNEPERQAERLRAAGLSTSAAAQGVSPNQATPLQSVELANQQTGNPMQAASFSSGSPLIQMLSGISDIISVARNLVGLKRDNIQTKKESNELDFQIPFLMSRNAREEWANKLQIQDFEHNAKDFKYSHRALKWAAKNEKLRNNALKLANRVAETQDKMLRQQYEFAGKWNDKQIEEITERIANLKKEGENLDKQGKQIESQTNLNNATAANAREDTENKKKQGKILDSQSEIVEIEKILKQYGVPDGDQQQTMAAFIASKKLDRQQTYDFLLGLRDYQRQGYEIFDQTRGKYEYYLEEYFKNVWSKGSSQQGQFGAHQWGFYRPLIDRSGLGPLLLGF